LAEVRGAKGLNIKVEGLNELQKQFGDLKKMPKKYLTKAAKAGVADPLKTAKANAPVGKRTATKGMLKRGLYKKMETPNKRNKTVYRVQWNPKYSNIYNKPSSGKYGGTPPKAYYPFSVEYGFKTAKGYKRGQYFVEKAIKQTQRNSLQKIVESLNDSITELLGK
jgi:hypothetical protein